MRRFLSVFKINKESRRYKFIQGIIETESISVLQFLRYLLSFWKQVVFFLLVFLILGVISATSKGPLTYTTSSLIIPEGGAPPKPSIGGELSDLLKESAAPINGNLGVTSFPGIMENTPFLLEILNEEIISEKYKGYVPLKVYLEDLDLASPFSKLVGQIKTLPARFIELFEKKQSDNVGGSDGEAFVTLDTLKQITEKELSLIGILSNVVTVEGENSITIETTMPEAKVSTRLNNLILDKLVEEVTRIKTAKQQRNLKLIKEQLDTARINFEQSQLKLASFRDANKGSNSAVFQSTLERLDSDYKLYFNIYSSLAAEYELAKIDLIKETPFYEVFEPAYVPNDIKSGFSLGPLIKNLAIGFVLGVLFLVIQTLLILFSIFKTQLSKAEL